LNTRLFQSLRSGLTNPNWSVGHFKKAKNIESLTKKSQYNYAVFKICFDRSEYLKIGL
jgi:hypothetical protein